jgi:hypothetical protein
MVDRVCLCPLLFPPKNEGRREKMPWALDDACASSAMLGSPSAAARGVGLPSDQGLFHHGGP